MADFTGSAAAGITAGLSTGNPLVGLVTFGVNLFASSSADNAQQDYQDELAAAALKDEAKTKAAATIAKEENEIKRGLDIFAAEQNRKALSYRATMARAGVTAFAQGVGLAGSSVEKTAQSRITGQEASGLNQSLKSEASSNILFELAQTKLDVLSGLVEPDEALEALGLGPVVGEVEALGEPLAAPTSVQETIPETPDVFNEDNFTLEPVSIPTIENDAWNELLDTGSTVADSGVPITVSEPVYVSPDYTPPSRPSRPSTTSNSGPSTTTPTVSVFDGVDIADAQPIESTTETDLSGYSGYDVWSIGL